MLYLRLTVLGVMSFLPCFSAVLSAQDLVASSPELVAPGTTNPSGNVWGAFSPAVKMPGSHYASTNADGSVINHFNMQPVVTSMPLLTNELSVIEQKLAALEPELKAIPQRESILRASWMQDGKIMANVVTNFVPADAEGKKIKQRMNELEKEFKVLRTEMMKRLELDPDYIKAKAKLDEDAAAYKALQEKKTKLREETNALRAQLFAGKELKNRELTKQASKEKPGNAAP